MSAIFNPEDKATLFILAEPVRIQIMELIASRGELCAKDILPEFKLTQPTLSHHMALLTESGLLNARKQGRCVYYSINHETIKLISEMLLSLNEPPVVITTAEARAIDKRKTIARRTAVEKAPVLKKNSSVPIPKARVESPDIEKMKKDKKKKKNKDKDDKKKKDKKKKK